MLEPLTGDTMRQADGSPLADARNYLRQALGALMEVSDRQGQPASITSEAAARHLLGMFREGAFENTGDAMALDALESGADISDIIENWLRGIANES